MKEHSVFMDWELLDDISVRCEKRRMRDEVGEEGKAVTGFVCSS